MNYDTQKEIVAKVLLFIRNILNPIFSFKEVSVLCYHSLSNTPVTTAVSPKVFEEHIILLRKNGYVFISLNDIVLWMKGIKNIPKKSVAITFDDGYADFETNAMPLLRKYNVPVTLFLVGDGEASRPALHNDILLLSAHAIETLKQEPLVEIGYHSMTHANVSTLSGDALVNEMRASFPARFFAYSGGNYSDEAKNIAEKLKYEAAFSIKPTLVEKQSDRYLMPRTVITTSMPPWRIMFSVSKASQWYRDVGHLFSL